MNKLILIFLSAFVISCSDNSHTKPATDTKEPTKSKSPTINDSDKVNDSEKVREVQSETREFKNMRFRNVNVKKTGVDTYQITGQGQIFEASFNWVVEDGHNELKHGYQMTDAGAPEWGNFNFTIRVSKERSNSSLHLILYEASAKDGSRQHELKLPLPV